MSAARYDLVIDQGSDFAIEFTVAEAGTAKNLTGYSARAQLRAIRSLLQVYRPRLLALFQHLQMVKSI